MNPASRELTRMAEWPLWRRCTIAVILVTAATLLCVALDPFLENHYLYIVYFAAALAAGLLLDAGSSAIVLVLGAVAAVYCFIPPYGSFRIQSARDQVGTALYLLAGGLIAALTERIRHITLRARASTAAAEAAMAARRQTEEEYRAAFELAAVGKALSDPATGRLLRVNDRFCQMTGYSREELLQRTFLDITHPDDRTANRADTERLLRGETQSLIFEKRYIRKDGRTIWVNLAAALARDREGRPWQVTATAEDITARKENERALRESQERFQYLAATVPAFVWITTADRQATFVNRRWCSYTGLSFHESMGNGWIRAVHPDDKARATHLWIDANARCKPYESELRFRRSDGEYRWFFTRAEPVLDEAGNITAWFGTNMDIHDRKLAQERLARSAAELARSNEDLENFAHIAAHDLKEPLRGIRLTIGFLSEDLADKLTERERVNLGSLDRLATRMHDLLDAMLEYSRVGRSGLNIHEQDPCKLLAEVVRDLKPLLEQEHATITIDSPLPIIRCDPTLVSNLFVNLISNAIKYNHSDPKFVHIGAGRKGSVQVFHVRDNGIGIAPQHADQVFRMFKRLHPREKFGGGTGAGLAIVKKIVERHGGRIWFESDVGRGTTFYFTLAPQPRPGDEPASVPGRIETSGPRARGIAQPGGPAAALPSQRREPSQPRPED